MREEASLQNIGARTAQKILGTPRAAAEHPVDTLEGLHFRQMMARWQPMERIVFQAVREGYTDMDSLPIATGLTTEQIRDAMSSLVKRGVVTKFGADDERA